MKRYVFFDLDGTLADTDGDIRGAWKATLADLGLECPEFDAKFIAGPPIDEMTKTLFPESYTEELAEKIRIGFAGHYDRDGFPMTREYPGVLDEVRRLKERGFKVAIVTNKRYEGALALADYFGWREVFDGIFAGDMHRNDAIGKLRKPELLGRVLTGYGAKPEEAIMVGDTVSDFEAAKKNGIESIAVAWGYGKEEELKMANFICRALPFPI